MELAISEAEGKVLYVYDKNTGRPVGVLLDTVGGWAAYELVGPPLRLHPVAETAAESAFQKGG